MVCGVLYCLFVLPNVGDWVDDVAFAKLFYLTRMNCNGMDETIFLGCELIKFIKLFYSHNFQPFKLISNIQKFNPILTMNSFQTITSSPGRILSRIYFSVHNDSNHVKHEGVKGLR